MKNKKPWVFVLVLVLLVLAGLNLLLFGVVVPKSSFLALPQKWWRIPLGQPRQGVYDYLGQPVSRDKQGIEIWENGTKGKKYRLRLYYLNDTVPKQYSIHYMYENRLLKKDYLLDSGAVR